MSDTVLYLVAVITRLLSSRYQDVFAPLVPCCCDKSGTSYYHFVDDGDRLAITCCNKTNMDSTIGCHQRVTCRRHQTCWNKFLQVCWPHQPCYKTITTCIVPDLSQLATSSMNTPC